MNKKLAALVEEIRKDISASLNFDADFAEFFKGLGPKEKLIQFKLFRAEALLKPFTLKVNGVGVKVAWKDMTKKQKSAVKTRLWRLGKLIGVKLGKTPVRNPPPPPENDSNGAAVVLPEELSGKAPREKARGLKAVLSALMERTGWSKVELLAEITAILK